MYPPPGTYWTLLNRAQGVQNISYVHAGPHFYKPNHTFANLKVLNNDPLIKPAMHAVIIVTALQNRAVNCIHTTRIFK